MRSGSSAYTRKLSTARLEFATDRRLRTGLHVVGAAALICLAAAAGLHLYANGDAPAARLFRLQRENESLRTDVARLRTELEMERSTRKALDGQVAQLNERANALQNQVDFFNAQGGRPRKAR
jgi:septal ring factor EnvC (AmiA/AmiB activator)